MNAVSRRDFSLLAVGAATSPLLLKADEPLVLDADFIRGVAASGSPDAMKNLSEYLVATGFYDQAVPLLWEGPQFQAVDLGVVQASYDSLGIWLDTDRFSAAAGMASEVDLYSLAPAMMSGRVRTVLNGGSVGGRFVPLGSVDMGTVGIGAGFIAGGGALATIGLNISAGTFASGMLATALVTGGTAFIIIGLGLLAYAGVKAAMSR